MKFNKTLLLILTPISGLCQEVTEQGSAAAKSTEQLMLETDAFSGDSGILMHCESLSPSLDAVVTVNKHLSEIKPSFGYVYELDEMERFRVGEEYIGDDLAVDFCSLVNASMINHDTYKVAQNIALSNSYLSSLILRNYSGEEGGSVDIINSPMKDRYSIIISKALDAKHEGDLSRIEDYAFDLLDAKNRQGFLLLSSSYGLAGLRGDSYAAMVAFYKSGEAMNHLKDLYREISKHYTEMEVFALDAAAESLLLDYPTDRQYETLVHKNRKRL